MSTFWKTFLKKRIDQIENIAVYENRWYRWLTFSNSIIQTCIHRHHPHQYALSYINPFTLGVRTHPGELCLLGLGGGGVLHAIQPHLNSSSITAIESNTKMIQIAYEYFMLGHIKNLEIIHADANLFVRNSAQQYQHLLIDLFSEQGMPSFCSQIDFITHGQQLLTKDGLMSMNFAYISDAWQTLPFIRARFGQNTICIPVKKSGNLIVIASQNHLNHNWLEPWLKIRALKKVIWDASWGYIGYQ